MSNRVFTDRFEELSMDHRLRAGIALYNAEERRAAREAWGSERPARLDAGSDTDGTDPPVLRADGEALSLSDLDFEASAVAAASVAGAYGYDEELIARASTFARRDLDRDRATSPFVTLVLDFVRGGNRAIVVKRLREHVSRRAARNADLDGLFGDGG